jgi:hypothetical protein
MCLSSSFTLGLFFTGLLSGCAKLNIYCDCFVPRNDKVLSFSECINIFTYPLTWHELMYCDMHDCIKLSPKGTRYPTGTLRERERLSQQIIFY